uniref:Uncharacterized protein n=1 Tax=Strombidium inclinatum TaxID=197538 RepID=A0A7S3IYF5_9SPIT|mmetsp:Transcript_9502/g.14557  ORF Transcript_9502/g.14557 Transcript_9502/m.14557 type:complete len:195 (+) Transcript_9502:712-1296(+)
MEKFGGGKVGIEAMSDSLANSMTNFSKNRDNESFMYASHLPQFSQIPKLVGQNFGSSNLKKGKKRFHQSFLDDSRVSPRHPQLPDFSGSRKRRNDVLGGYDTEVTGGLENGNFNMTYDEGFTNAFDSNDGTRSIQPKKNTREFEVGGVQAKKIFLKKQTVNTSQYQSEKHSKAKSQSNVHRYFTDGKIGHKCFI